MSASLLNKTIILAQENSAKEKVLCALSDKIERRHKHLKLVIDAEGRCEDWIRHFERKLEYRWINASSDSWSHKRKAADGYDYLTMHAIGKNVTSRALDNAFMAIGAATSISASIASAACIDDFFMSLLSALAFGIGAYSLITLPVVSKKARIAFLKSILRARGKL